VALVLVAALITSWVLARALDNACTRANVAQLQINGASYGHMTHLYADIGFMNSLWTGEALFASDSDSELQRHLRRARFSLRWGTAIGFVSFFAALIFVVIRFF
jgi:hypothetical protein